MNKVIKFLLCVSLPLIVGGISGFYTSKSIGTWHAFLNKPSFNPPNYLFGPVWTTLYLLMGISLFIIINKNKTSPLLITVFGVQLLLNFLWSFIFFNYHQIGWALVEIIVLWISILTMIILFYKANKWAAYLNIPYLLWVSFASVLNWGFYILN